MNQISSMYLTLRFAPHNAQERLFHGNEVLPPTRSHEGGPGGAGDFHGHSTLSKVMSSWVIICKFPHIGHAMEASTPHHSRAMWPYYDITCEAHLETCKL